MAQKSKSIQIQPFQYDLPNDYKPLSSNIELFSTIETLILPQNSIMLKYSNLNLAISKNVDSHYNSYAPTFKPRATFKIRLNE